MSVHKVYKELAQISIVQWLSIQMHVRARTLPGHGREPVDVLLLPIGHLCLHVAKVRGYDSSDLNSQSQSIWREEC
jgi:hypothetical protein